MTSDWYENTYHITLNPDDGRYYVHSKDEEGGLGVAIQTFATLEEARTFAREEL